jgi:hypothetical protein
MSAVVRLSGGPPASRQIEKEMLRSGGITNRQGGPIMLSTRIFGLVCAVAVFVCLAAATVSAQPLDKRTLFTFSGPVTLPGVTLPAGQYLFRLADPDTSSKVVPVLTTQAQTTTTEQTNTADLSRVASGGQETQVSASAAPTAGTPTGNTQEGQIASSSLSIATPPIPAVGRAPTVTQTASTQPTRTQLPRTATDFPLVAMVGTLALLSAATLWYWRTPAR